MMYHHQTCIPDIYMYMEINTKDIIKALMTTMHGNGMILTKYKIHVFMCTLRESTYIFKKGLILSLAILLLILKLEERLFNNEQQNQSRRPWKKLEFSKHFVTDRPVASYKRNTQINQYVLLLSPGKNMAPLQDHDGVRPLRSRQMLPINLTSYL